MDTKDTYFSISSLSEGLYKESGSRFIAYAYPVESEEEVKSILDNLRRRYHDARHICFAYRLGRTGEKWRASDDGEPSGTAGRQILGQVDSAGLSDVMVAVVRYFGGILLGVPGLIRAYRSAAADALCAAAKIEKIEGRWYTLDFGYEDMPAVMKIIKDLDLPAADRNFDSRCTLRVRVRGNLEQKFLQSAEKFLTLGIK